MPTPTWEQRLDEYVADRFRGRKVVGGAVIIAKDGEVLYSNTYGHKNATKKELVTLDTCFRIASVTKLVSVIGLMQLVEKYDIDLETPVKEIVGFKVMNPSFPEDVITIRQVLSHTSSLLQTQHYFQNWETMTVYGPYFSKKDAPGMAYEYSNMNGGLIGAMIEAITGQSVNTYMQENVFDPLGINAAYHPTVLKDRTDIAAQLNKTGGNVFSAARILQEKYDDTCNPIEHTDRTSGSLYISANGLIRIISMLEQGGELDGVRILKEATIQEMMQDQRTVPGTSVYAQSKYGLCIAKVEGMPGGTWYGHQGQKEGLSSNIYFQPATGLSIAVIANGYEAHSEDGVVTIARVFMEKAQEFLTR